MTTSLRRVVRSTATLGAAAALVFSVSGLTSEAQAATARPHQVNCRTNSAHKVWLGIKGKLTNPVCFVGRGTSKTVKIKNVTGAAVDAGRGIVYYGKKSHCTMTTREECFFSSVTITKIWIK